MMVFFANPRVVVVVVVVVHACLSVHGVERKSVASRRHLLMVLHVAATAGPFFPASSSPPLPIVSSSALPQSARRTPSRPPGRRAEGEEGTGLIASLAGLLAFLALLLFAVQTLVALHTRSVVTDAAYEGARAVAGARDDHRDPVAVAEAQADASEKVRRLLGRFGEKVELDWTGTTDETVSLKA